MKVRMFALLAIALAACSSDSSGPDDDPSFAGTWASQIIAGPYDAAVTMTLAHNKSTGSISGSGLWGQTNLSITGAAAANRVSITLVAPGGQFSPGTMNYTGDLQAGVITGSITGPQWSGAASAVFRRP